MKKFIAISLLSIMSLGLLSGTAIENNNYKNILKMGENHYIFQKKNNGENFVKFNILKTDSTKDQNDVKDEQQNNNNDNNNLEKNNNFNAGLTANDIYPNNAFANHNHNNNINTIPYGYNGTFNEHGYGYNGFNGMNYAYGYPMDNMRNISSNNYQNNNLNTYNMPTYTPSRSNINSYENELNTPSYSNLNTYKKDNSQENTNIQNDVKDKNDNKNYTHLINEENNYIKTNNNYNKFNNSSNEQTMLSNDYTTNNGNIEKNNFYLENKDNYYIEQNLSKLIKDIKNLCINENEYNITSENYINSRNEISLKIDDANKIIKNLKENNIYLDNIEQKNKIIEQTNKIYEKLQNIEENTRNKLGFSNYGLRFSNSSISHFELYDTISSNYPIYQEINSELDELITLLSNVYIQNKKTNTIVDSNKQNSTQINDMSNDKNLQYNKNINDETKTINLSSSENKTDNGQKQQNKLDTEKNVLDKQYDVQKPEPANTSSKDNKIEQTNAQERIQNRKETLNKYLPKHDNGQTKKQSISYHNPYEPNNNPLLNS